MSGIVFNALFIVLWITPCHPNSSVSMGSRERKKKKKSHGAKSGEYREVTVQTFFLAVNNDCTVSQILKMDTMDSLWQTFQNIHLVGRITHGLLEEALCAEFQCNHRRLSIMTKYCVFPGSVLYYTLPKIIQKLLVAIATRWQNNTLIRFHSLWLILLAGHPFHVLPDNGLDVSPIILSKYLIFFRGSWSSSFFVAYITIV